MRFNLPKPQNGWSEFAWQVCIVVIGVLTALGAEQIVETLHWQAQARETETVLEAEIQDSANAVAERIAVNQCLRNQLGNLRKASDATAPSRFTPPADVRRVFPDLYATPWRAWAQGGWGSATASGVLNRLPTERLYAYAQVYKAIEDMDGIVRRERETKSGLSLILAREMSPEQSGTVLMALTDLDRARADMLVAGRDLLNSAAILDIRPKREATHSLAAFIARYGVCRPNPT